MFKYNANRSQNDLKVSVRGWLRQQQECLNVALLINLNGIYFGIQRRIIYFMNGNQVLSHYGEVFI